HIHTSETTDPEKIFWSHDIIKLKFEALKEQTTVSRPIKALTVEMHAANTIVEARCLELEAELANLRNKSHHDNQEELIHRFSNLEVNHLNLQLKYKNLKDNFKNNPPTPDKDTPNFNSVFVIDKMQASLQGKHNVIRQLKKKLSQLAENDKIKQYYKELYDSIKITRAKHIEQVEPNVLARGKYAINVKPIVPRLRNNMDAHLDYLRHLKESVETIRDIELLEYAIGTCPQDSQQRDKQLAHVPLIRKKQVTFAKPYDKLNNNTSKPVATVNTQKTNVPMPHSTGVNRCLKASGSQPRSSTRKNRISPAKGVNKLPGEDHPRTNKSHFRTSNRVDYSSRLKRTVVQIVLWYLDSGCSKQMTGDRSRLMNFLKNFIGIVRFGNEHFGAIMGYRDYVIGNSVISRVYYMEGLGHNLFSIGQFCNSNLEVAFRKHSCYVQDTDGVELIKGSRGCNLYTISVEDMMKSSLICLLSKSSKNNHGYGIDV
nr:integrase, catalytic region, zinc finger, CCHC-type, peptidase aspartic, catalytic [Tanacetum cinerariifolium]